MFKYIGTLLFIDLIIILDRLLPTTKQKNTFFINLFCENLQICLNRDALVHQQQSNSGGAELSPGVGVASGGGVGVGVNASPFGGAMYDGEARLQSDYYSQEQGHYPTFLYLCLRYCFIHGNI